MMYLPKLFAYASLILLMFEKMTFTQISHNFLLSVFMDLPFQKVKKNIVWGKYRDWGNRYIYPLYRQLKFFLSW